MRLVALILFALACAIGTAAAQLDKVLAPVVANAAAETSEAQPFSKASRETAIAKPATHLLTADEILPQLERQLIEHFSLEGQLKLGLTSPWKTRVVVPAEYEIAVTDYPGQGVSSAFVLRCKISVNAQSITELQIPLRAQLWREVWIAGGRLDRGLTPS